MKKQLHLLILALSLAVSLTACDSSDTAGDSTASDAAYDNSASDAADSGNSSEAADSGSASDTAPIQITFSTETIDGESVTEAMMSDAKVILVNFWEPWCGPCVNEMPDLEALYEKYKEQGLLILGIYTPGQYDDKVADVLNEIGITYPVLKRTADMEYLQTGYVPTSYFCDSTGTTLYNVPIIGGQSYDGWEMLIREYLEL